MWLPHVLESYIKIRYRAVIWREWALEFVENFISINFGSCSNKLLYSKLIVLQQLEIIIMDTVKSKLRANEYNS